jgi:hypothetical protein
MAVGLAGWFHVSGAQRALPGPGAVTDLALAAAFDQYRAAATAAALAGIPSAFLVVVGLRASLAHLFDLAPQAALRDFTALFVLSAAANAAAVVVLLFGVVSAPTRGAPLVGHPELFGLLAGPLLGAAAVLRLRSHMAALHAEALARHKAAKPA